MGVQAGRSAASSGASRQPVHNRTAERVDGARRAIADAIAIADVLADERAQGFDLVVAGGFAARDFIGLVA